MPKGITITIDGIMYDSIAAAGRALGLSYDQIRYRYVDGVREIVNTRALKYYTDHHEERKEYCRDYYKTHRVDDHGTVYRIVCDNTDTVYIGSTSRYEDRQRAHHSLLANNQHDSERLQNDFDNYGWDSLSFEVIELCEIDQCFEREKYHMYIEQPNGNKRDPVSKSTLLPWREDDYAEGK